MLAVKNAISGAERQSLMSNRIAPFTIHLQSETGARYSTNKSTHPT